MAYTLLYLSGIADTRVEAEALTPTSGTIFFCKDTSEYIKYNGATWGDLVYGDIDKVHVDDIETNSDKNFISDSERADWDSKQSVTAAFTTTYSGLYYLGLMVTATTVPTIKGNTARVGGQLQAEAPSMGGTSNTGLTTALPATANAPGTVTTSFWGCVS